MIWLDDLRPEPEGYLRVKTSTDCINLLMECSLAGYIVDHLALDHDLGENESIVGNGYLVVCWIEERMSLDPEYVPPTRITVHSDNASARVKMKLGIESIQRRVAMSML